MTERMTIEFEPEELELGMAGFVPDALLGDMPWLNESVPEAKLMRMFSAGFGLALAERHSGPILIWPTLTVEHQDENKDHPEKGPGTLYSCRCRWGKVTEV